MENNKTDLDAGEKLTLNNKLNFKAKFRSKT